MALKKTLQADSMGEIFAALDSFILSLETSINPNTAYFKRLRSVLEETADIGKRRDILAIVGRIENVAPCGGFSRREATQLSRIISLAQQFTANTY